MTLIGETTGRPTGERVPINIDENVRERLRNLLYEPEMRGVGWSEFIDRAVEQAEGELAVTRAGRRLECTCGVKTMQAEYHQPGCPIREAMRV